MTTPELLANLPDDARVSLTIGTGDLRVGDFRKAFAGPDPHRVLTTGEAASTFGYSADSWRRWASEIKGAYQDKGERAHWRLPYSACVEHLERLASARSKRRRKRGPWSASAQARASGPESIQEGSLVGGGSTPVERRSTDDARPTTLRLAR